MNRTLERRITALEGRAGAGTSRITAIARVIVTPVRDEAGNLLTPRETGASIKHLGPPAWEERLTAEEWAVRKAELIACGEMEA